ncbi:flagellar basal body-associated protein FliL [Shewanella eurypsychrophilus]|uniref:Flagellar protein FliL n=2 Tax=Shewanellaceae TaxID=267890 RepID=A0ABX8S3C5_9GAMM|nr:flagellar basal body-associated protein FliL [Shewanella sp. YLB-09]QXP45017.1 flagellar basal body-associated protein FliL [Shewanella eurypsychrophilus]
MTSGYLTRIASLLLIAAMSTVSLGAYAEDEENEEKQEIIDTYAYYGFEPDLITNYIPTGKKLGFVRIGIELMVKDPDDLLALEHHDPLLRAALLEIMGSQTSDKVKSLTGREEIRRECYDTLNRLIEQETGKSMIVNLLFTKYLYD